MQGEDNGIPAGGTLTNTDSAPPSPRDGTLSEDAVDATSTQRSSQLPLVSVPSDFYAMEQEVGRGGVGVVTKAHDRRLGRSVALKRLQRPEPQARLRFEREMRITAKLQHPGVVPIHEAGVLATGEPFYAMKLVEGRSLKELIGERRSIGERLQLLPNLVAVIETIAYAHNVGIIHRDIKPSNIIVGAYGETVVIDWGLAKDLAVVEDETFKAGPFRTSVSGVMTVTGQIVGTPAYMPPEQAEGADVDRRADVYALGAVLRQLLTGAAPYSGRSSQDVLKAVLAAPPKSLAEVAPDAPKDLAAIANKAMAREASGRYADAAALLADLKSFLNGRLVSAYAYAPTERLRKWAAARRGVVVTAMVAVVILVGVGAASVARIIKERDAALESRRATVTQSNALLREQSGRELDQGNLVRGFEILKAYPRDADDWDKVFPLVHRIGMAGLPNAWVRPSIASVWDSAIAIHPTASLVGVASSSLLEVWDAADSRLAVAVPLRSPSKTRINELEVISTHTATYWVVALDNGDVSVITTLSDQSAPSTTNYRPCGAGTIADTASEPHRTSIVVACTAGEVLMFDVRTGHTSRVAFHEGGVSGVAFAWDGMVASAGLNGVLRVGQVQGVNNERSVGLGAPLHVVAVQPACKRVIVSTQDGRVAIVDETMSYRFYLVEADRPLTNLAIDDRCQLAFGISHTNTLLVVDLIAQTVLASKEASSATFYPGRSALVIGGEDGQVEYWEPLSGWRQSWRSSSKPVRRVGASRAGDIMAFGDILSVYSRGRLPRVLVLEEPAVTLATAGNEGRVFLGGRRGGVTMLDLATDVVADYPGKHDGLAFVKASGAGDFYSTGTKDGCVLRWSGDMSPEELMCVPGGATDINTMAPASVYLTTRAGSIVAYDASHPGHFDVATGLSDIKRIGVDVPGDRLLVSTKAGTIHIFSRDLTGETRVDAQHPMGLASGTPSGKIVAVTDDGYLFELHPAIKPNAHSLSCAASSTRTWFSPERDLVLAGCDNGKILAWPEVASLGRLSLEGSIRDVDGQNDAALFAACSLGGGLAVIDLVTHGVRAASTSVPLENLEIIASRGTLLVAAQQLPLLAIWDLAEISEPFPLDDEDLFDWLHRTGDE